MKALMKAALAGVIASGLLVSQNSSAQERVLVERVPGRSVTISHAYADAQGENMVVAGQVSRWHELHIPGHVDVKVYGPDGNLLATEKARLPGIMSQRKGRLDLPFSCRFDFVPPHGSRISVGYHWLPGFLTGIKDGYCRS